MLNIYIISSWFVFIFICVVQLLFEDKKLNIFKNFFMYTVKKAIKVETLSLFFIITPCLFAQGEKIHLFREKNHTPLLPHGPTLQLVQMVKWVYDPTLLSPPLTSISPSLKSILQALAWSTPSFAHLNIIEKLQRLPSLH